VEQLVSVAVNVKLAATEALQNGARKKNRRIANVERTSGMWPPMNVPLSTSQMNALLCAVSAPPSSTEANNPAART